MTDIYQYKGKQVEVVERFSGGLWVFKCGSETGQGHESEFVPIQSQPQPRAVSVASATSTVEPTAQVPEVVVKVNINECKVPDLAKAVKGIGRGFATRILGRKPDGGYQSWEQLIAINDDLALNWDEIRRESESIVEF